MIDLLYRLAKPALFTLPPERAHALALGAWKCCPHTLRRALVGAIATRPVKVMGITFPNPVGLAAGFDKNASAVDALGDMGFGFIEVGTLTPQPQTGNPAPRLFRIPKHQALINRMGFNNDGIDCAIERLRQRRYRGIIGVNIGKNKDTPLEQASKDYLHALRSAHPVADYITINLSSPNTPHLRQLQNRDHLDQLLRLLKKEQGALQEQTQRYVPLALKIAPDLEEDSLCEIASLSRNHALDAIIATNTTIERPHLENAPQAMEVGGLSGLPLRPLADRALKIIAREIDGRIPLIASGGILSSSDAQRKLDLGASLVQLYTGLIYRGPGLVRELSSRLV